MSWIKSQVNFWYGRTYEHALLNDWDRIHELLNASSYRHGIERYLTIHDTTEEAVAKRYIDLPNYNFKVNGEVVNDWLNHDVAGKLSEDHAFPVLMVDEIGPDLPVISYNRSITHLQAYAILWPLEYHDRIALQGLTDAKSLHRKIPKIIFRGALSGPLRNANLPGGYIKVSRAEFLQRASMTSHISDLGITFVPPQVRISPEYPPIQEALSALFKPLIPFSELLNFKYILCLEGADISSGLGAVIGSKSIPLCPFPFCFNVWYFNGLNPWEHFVPVASDGSNLEEIFEYCESHPEMMNHINRNGRLHMRRMLDRKFISAIKREVVSLWNLRQL